jgi:glycosyltransferase involved in cell wall biosynthesis
VGEAEALRKEYEDELHKLVEELGVSNHVVFAGAQSKVAECLSLADIVVSANYRKPEAFGRSMAEALAMDKPVVATAFGGALDIVEDGVNGALVAPDPKATPQEMAVKFSNAIRFVAHSKFERLREKALEKFSFDRMAASSLAVYNEFDREIAK